MKTNRGATWAYNQAKWLYDHGVEVVTVLPSCSGGYAEKYKESGLQVIEGNWTLPVSRPWKLFSRSKEIRKIVNDVNPDLIHLHFVTNVLMVRVALRRNKTPRLFQVPGPLHLESFFFNFIERLVATKSDYWAGACKKTCDIYRSKGIDESRVSLAYYGSPMSNSENSGLKSSKLRSEYGIDEHEKIVAMVSYFYAPKRYLGQTRGLKGHEDFIDAMQMVIKTHPDVRAVIIGNAWDGAEKYEKSVISYAKERLGDRVIFTGYRNDVKDIYSEIDIAVHPSHSENLGGAAESLAYGVPTIATNIGGFPDIVVDGETGFLVPSKSPVKLSDAICRMLDDENKAKEMANAGQSLVRELLDIAQTAGKIKSVYEDILSKQ